MQSEPSLETLKSVGCIGLRGQHLHHECLIINPSGLEWSNVWRRQLLQSERDESGIYIDCLSRDLVLGPLRVIRQSRFRRFLCLRSRSSSRTTHQVTRFSSSANIQSN